MEKKKVVKNILFLSGARFFANFALAVLGIFVAQYLKPELFGVYSTGFAYTGIFFIFTEIGLGQVLIRDESYVEGNLKKFLGNALILKFLFSGCILFLCLTALRYTNYDALTREFIMWLAIGVVLFKGIGESTFLALFQIRGELDRLSLIETAVTILQCILFAVIIIHNLPLIYFGYAFTLVTIIGILIKGGFLRQTLSTAIITLKNSWYLIKASIPFGLTNIFSVIYMQVAIVLLSFMDTKTEVGFYAAPYRLMLAIFIIPTVVYTVILPRTFQMAKHQLPLLRETYRLFSRTMIVLGVPITGFLFVFSRDLILFLFKEEFASSIIILQILSWFVILRFYNHPPAIVLTSIDRQDIRARIQGLVAGLNIVANLILIPIFHARGAAIATLLTDSTLAVLYTMKVRSFKLGIPILGDLVVPVVCCTISCVIARILAAYTHFIIAGFAGIVLYSLLLFLMNYFSETEKNIIYHLLPWGRKPQERDNVSEEK